MKVSNLIFAILFCVVLVSCKKTGSLTVTVNKQSAGQPAEIASGVTVLLRSISDSTRFYMERTSNLGLAKFDDIRQDSYRVSSQVWDGSAGLYDEDVVDVRAGTNKDVVLLLQ